MLDPLAVPQNSAELRKALTKMLDEEVPSAMRAAVWRTAYRDFGNQNEHVMHQIAYDNGLGELTGSDWRYAHDIGRYEPGPHSGPLQGVRDSQYYRGYLLSICVDQQAIDTWLAWFTLVDPSFKHAPFKELSPQHSLAAAYETAMRQCIAEVDALLAPLRSPLADNVSGE